MSIVKFTNPDGFEISNYIKINDSLNVVGGLKFNIGSENAGYFLTSDNFGNATWTPIDVNNYSEQIQDIVGSMFTGVDTNYISYAYNDSTGKIESSFKQLAIINVETDTTSTSLSNFVATHYTTGTEYQEADVIILTNTSNGTQIYIHNGGTTGTTSDFTILQNPVDTQYIRSLFSAVSPLSYDPNTGSYSIQKADATHDGYLSSTDWNTFNNKSDLTQETVEDIVGNMVSSNSEDGVQVDYIDATGKLNFTNTNKGSDQFIFKNISDGTNSIVADNNNDILRLNNDGSIGLIFDTINDIITFKVNFTSLNNTDTITSYNSALKQFSDTGLTYSNLNLLMSGNSPEYIQNQTALVQPAEFWVQNNSQIGGSSFLNNRFSIVGSNSGAALFVKSNNIGAVFTINDSSNSQIFNVNDNGNTTISGSIFGLNFTVSDNTDTLVARNPSTGRLTDTGYTFQQLIDIVTGQDNDYIKNQYSTAQDADWYIAGKTRQSLVLGESWLIDFNNGSGDTNFAGIGAQPDHLAFSLLFGSTTQNSIGTFDFSPRQFRSRIFKNNVTRRIEFLQANEYSIKIESSNLNTGYITTNDITDTSFAVITGGNGTTSQFSTTLTNSSISFAQTGFLYNFYIDATGFNYDNNDQVTPGNININYNQDTFLTGSILNYTINNFILGSILSTNNNIDLLQIYGTVRLNLGSVSNSDTIVARNTITGQLTNTGYTYQELMNIITGVDGDYIKNTTSLQSSANYYIDGIGRVGRLIAGTGVYSDNTNYPVQIFSPNGQSAILANGNHTFYVAGLINSNTGNSTFTEFRAVNDANTNIEVGLTSSNYSGSWVTGAITGKTGFIGTSTSSGLPLTLYTNNIAAVNITTGQNVLIGSATDNGAKFQINSGSVTGNNFAQITEGTATVGVVSQTKNLSTSNTAATQYRVLNDTNNNTQIGVTSSTYSGQFITNGLSGAIGFISSTLGLTISSGGLAAINIPTTQNVLIGSASDNGAKLQVTGRQTITAGILTSGQNALNVTGTLSSGTNQFGVNYSITSSTSTGAQVAFNSTLTAGGGSAVPYYTGKFLNLTAGTGTSLWSAGITANVGAVALTAVTTTGYNAGLYGYAEGGNINVGSFGYAAIDKASATNIGLVGVGNNAGATSAQIGVLGFLGGGQPGYTTTITTTSSAAGIFDNGATTSDTLQVRDNGVINFKVADGGIITHNPVYTSNSTNTLQLYSFSSAITDNNTGTPYRLYGFNPAITSTVSISQTGNFIQGLNPTFNGVAGSTDIGGGGFNMVSVMPTFTNWRNVTTRGYYYNPTFTNVTGTTNNIAFENTTGNVLLGTTSGKTYIGDATTESGGTGFAQRLQIRDSLNAPLRNVANNTSTGSNSGVGWYMINDSTATAAIFLNGSNNTGLGGSGSFNFIAPNTVGTAYAFYAQTTGLLTASNFASTGNWNFGTSTTNAGYKVKIDSDANSTLGGLQVNVSTVGQPSIVSTQSSGSFGSISLNSQTNSPVTGHWHGLYNTINPAASAANGFIFDNQNSNMAVKSALGNFTIYSGSGGSMETTMVVPLSNITSAASTSRIQLPHTFNISTAGSIQFSSVLLNTTLNFTAGTHTYRGIYYNPTLTSLTGTIHIAFENTTGTNYFNTTSGNTAIGLSSGATITDKLYVNGTVGIQTLGTVSGTDTIVARNTTSGQLTNTTFTYTQLSNLVAGSTGNYIQNQITAAQSPASFWIDGRGIIGNGTDDTTTPLQIFGTNSTPVRVTGSTTGGFNFRLNNTNSGSTAYSSYIAVNNNSELVEYGITSSTYGTIYTGAITGKTAFINTSSGIPLTIGAGQSTSINIFPTTQNVVLGSNTDNGSKLQVTGRQTIAAGTLTDGQNALSITATMPATAASQNSAVNYNIGTGAATQSQYGLNIDFNGSNTSSVSFIAARFIATLTGTGTGVFTSTGTGNYSVVGATIGTTSTGYNVGSSGIAANGLINIGSQGKAITDATSKTNIGVTGTALNAGTTSAQIGGLFYLGNTTPTYLTSITTTSSAALIVDNGTQTSNIQQWRDNNSIVGAWEDNGGLVIGNSGTNNLGTAIPLLVSRSGNDYTRLAIHNTSSGSSAGSALYYYNNNGVAGAVILNSSSNTTYGGVSSMNYIAYNSTGIAHAFTIQNSTISASNFAASGNWNFGTSTSDGGYKVDITNTGSNGALRVQGTGLFTGNLTVSTGGSGTNTLNASTNLFTANQNTFNGQINFNAGNGVGDFVNISNSTSAATNNQLRFSSTFTFSTGTNVHTQINLTPTYNYTGGTSSIRGIYYNPTLTSLTGATHIAFENTTGINYFNTTSGNTAIGATSGASITDKLWVNGTVGIQTLGTVSNSDTVIARNTTTGQLTDTTITYSQLTNLATGNFIQNQNASAQTTSNFWIDGTGQAANFKVTTPTNEGTSATKYVTFDSTGLLKFRTNAQLISDNPSIVTSVVLNTPNVLYSTPINFSTTSNTATGSLTLNSQTANFFFAAPNGSNGTPTFRSIIAADLPDLSATYVPTTRTITINGTTFDLSANRTYNVGTVTSVALSLPSIFSVSGSPVTSSGTLTGSLVVQSANTVFAGPTTGASTTPTFRSLVLNDIPSLQTLYIQNQNSTTQTANFIISGQGELANLKITTPTNEGTTATKYVTFDSNGLLKFRTNAQLISDNPSIVTSVVLNTPNVLFTTPVNYSTVTNTATGTLSLATQSANTIFAGPSTGANATPTFRSLVLNDIPNLQTLYIQNQISTAQSNASSWIDGRSIIGTGTDSNYKLQINNDATTVNAVLVNGSTILTEGFSLLRVTGTLGTASTTQTFATNIQIVSSGSGSTVQTGAFNSEIQAGGTSSASYIAGRFANTTAGTGAAGFITTGRAGNLGVSAFASATTVGHNIGVAGYGSNGLINCGILGVSATTAANKTNIGVAGLGFQTSTPTGTTNQIGGFFYLGIGNPSYLTNSNNSAAIIIDNDGTTSDLIKLYDNGTLFARVVDGGRFLFGTTTDNNTDRLQVNGTTSTGLGTVASTDVLVAQNPTTGQLTNTTVTNTTLTYLNIHVNSNITTVTASTYNVNGNSPEYIINCINDCVVTLPTISSAGIGRTYKIFAENGKTVTVQRQGSDLIDGDTSDITVGYGMTTYIAMSSNNWRIE